MLERWAWVLYLRRLEGNIRSKHCALIDERPDVLCVVQRRIREMGPDTGQPPVIRNYFGLLFADKPWSHHLRQGRIASQLGIEASKENDDRQGSDHECGFRGVHIGVQQSDIRYLDYLNNQAAEKAIIENRRLS